MGWPGSGSSVFPWLIGAREPMAWGRPYKKAPAENLALSGGWTNSDATRASIRSIDVWGDGSRFFATEANPWALRLEGRGDGRYALRGPGQWIGTDGAIHTGPMDIALEKTYQLFDLTYSPYKRHYRLCGQGFRVVLRGVAVLDVLAGPEEDGSAESLV